jgi:hypothetical protein
VIARAPIDVIAVSVTASRRPALSIKSGALEANLARDSLFACAPYSDPSERRATNAPIGYRKILAPLGFSL